MKTPVTDTPFWFRIYMMAHEIAKRVRSPIVAGILAAMIATSVTVVCVADERIVCRWRAEGSAVVVSVDGFDAIAIEGIGPVWSDGGTGRAPADATSLRQTACDSGTEVRYGAANGAEWTTVAHALPTGDFVVELGSADGRFAAASPGQVVKVGKWIGLDLSQYSIAHGHPHCPKTFYLPGLDLFLCVWWDFEVAHASQSNWPAALCDLPYGDGPFAPAAAMRYDAGPDGKHANLHEALHIRVARRLWDAALPSLCQPSEYRKELVGLVYLDDWSGQNAADMQHMLGILKRLAWPHVGFLTIVQNWQAGGFD